MAAGTPPGPKPVAAARFWARMPADALSGYLALYREYGDAVRLPISRGRSFYLLNRPEHAEHVLVTAADRYPKAFTYRPLRAFLGSGLLTSEGEQWRRHRRIVQPVFAARHIGAFAGEMVAAVERRLARWRTDGVQTVDAAAELRTLTLDVVGRALFGADVAGSSARIGHAIETLQRTATLAAFVPGSPRLTRSVLRAVPGVAGSGVELEDLVRGIVEARSAVQVRTGPQDLLGLLMAGRDADGAALTGEEIRDEVMTLLVAGHETTSSALCWSLVLLSAFPAARERLEAEVDEVLGGRAPTADDAERLPWTRAVFSEAMRLYPPAWTVERDALVDDVVAGVPVPAGSTVAISPYLLHRDPREWPNPEGFAPERFLPPATHPRYAYLPFGGGRRICVGAGFATLEGTLVLAALHRAHRLDLTGAAPRARADITLRPRGPVPMRLVTR